MRTTYVGYRIENATLRVTTQRAPQFLDITDAVQELVEGSGIRYGVAVVFCRHTTAAIHLNENEPLLIQDMEEFLKRIAPRDLYYRHNDFGIRTCNMTEDECPNAHAHCQHLFFGSSESIPFEGGKLLVGRWQRIFLVELDRPREREIWIQIMGLGERNE